MNSRKSCSKDERWAKDRHLATRAECITCAAKRVKCTQLKCTRCRKVKNRDDFDQAKLERWTKHRELTKKAECKMCASARGVRTHEPKRIWKQTTYTCSQCKDPHPPGYYNYKKLATLEEQRQVYLAVCIACQNKKRRKIIQMRRMRP